MKKSTFNIDKVEKVRYTVFTKSNKEGKKMSIQVHPLNAIPIIVFVVVTNVMSYWHGRSENGWGIGGLIFTIILGTVGQILVGLSPMFW